MKHDRQLCVEDCNGFQRKHCICGCELCLQDKCLEANRPVAR